MTRTTRSFSNASADGAQLPRYFGKNGHPDQDPTKVKKDGHGKGNWGKEGDELDDIEGEFNFHRQRRHSNSAQQELGRYADRQSLQDEDDSVFEDDE